MKLVKPFAQHAITWSVTVLPTGIYQIWKFWHIFKVLGI